MISISLLRPVLLAQHTLLHDTTPISNIAYEIILLVVALHSYCGECVPYCEYGRHTRSNHSMQIATKTNQQQHFAWMKRQLWHYNRTLNITNESIDSKNLMFFMWLFDIFIGQLVTNFRRISLSSVFLLRLHFFLLRFDFISANTFRTYDNY